MDQKRILWTTMMILTLFPASALCQELTPKAGVYGGIGLGRFYDDEGSLGGGIVCTAGVEWRPLGRIGLRGELRGIHHTRDDYFKVRGNALAASASGVFYFSRSRVQPYIAGGVGLMKFSHAYGWPVIGVDVYRFHGVHPVINFGFGARLMINRHWSLDPQAHASFDTTSGAYSLIDFFSLSAAYHW